MSFQSGLSISCTYPTELIKRDLSTVQYGEHCTYSFCRDKRFGDKSQSNGRRPPMLRPERSSTPRLLGSQPLKICESSGKSANLLLLMFLQQETGILNESLYHIHDVSAQIYPAQHKCRLVCRVN